MSGSNYQATAYDQYYANPFYTAGQMAPVYPYMMHNEDGSIATDENGNSYDINNYRYLSGRNIIYEIQNDVNRKERNAVSGQVYGTISFLKDFAATVRGDLYNVNNTEKALTILIVVTVLLITDVFPKCMPVLASIALHKN